MKHRIIPTLLLITYCALLIKVMVFKDVPLIRIGTLMINFGGSQTGPANLVPFKTILVYLLGEKGLMIGGINLAGNIVLLLPVGFLIPLVFKRLSWKKMLIPAAVAGFAIEGMQMALQLGIFDIDDVILNALGVLAGYWMFTMLSKRLRSMRFKNIKLIAGLSFIAIAAIVLCIAAVYRMGQLPVSFEPAVVHVQSDGANMDDGGIKQGADPCGGTGGTGQIVSVGNHTLTIKTHNGLKELIKLTGKTTIRNSSGALLASNLKIGNRVTIVTFESDQAGNKIANAVFVCNTLR
jgi:glycopeptide antibiotics resistance protein